MTDIVERLRDLVKRHTHRDGDDDEVIFHADVAMSEAADEIELLRNNDEVLKHHLSAAAATIEECARSLEQIRQVCADNAGEGSNHKMALDFVHQIAIRALKEQK